MENEVKLMGTQLPSFVEEGSEVQEYIQMHLLMKKCEEAMKQYKARCAEIADGWKPIMKQYFLDNDKQSVDYEAIRVTYVLPTIRETLDQAKLKREFPEAYRACLKEAEVAGTLKITIRPEKLISNV